MTSLSTFTDEEKIKLVKLPYQVGVHISHADDAEGEEDDQQEMQALSNILRALPGLHTEQPLIQEIFQETVKRKEDWPSWHTGIFDLDKECQEAIALLKSKATQAEAKAYRKALLEVADAVARAAGEYAVFEIRHEPDSVFLKFLRQLSGIFSFTKSSDNNSLSNISPAEQDALDKLSQSLKVV